MSNTVKRYGVPYMGSKNAIVPDLIARLPKAKNFYDLFCGGCAVTHGALLSGKWEHFYANDIIGEVPQMFLDAIHGKFKNERRWIDRETFKKEWRTDAYVAYCWSFGNNPKKRYLYSVEIEPWKKALHYARVLNDRTLLQRMGIFGDGSAKDVKAHEKEYKEKYIKWWLKQQKCQKQIKIQKSLQSLQSLQSLERLERLEISKVSYDQVKIKPNSLLYCDTPYEDTSEYNESAFDHKRFYDWACKQTELVVISSYNISDPRFQKVVSLKKNSLLAGGASKVVNECLYVPRKQIELWEDRKKK